MRLSPRDTAHWVRIRGALKVDPEATVTELEKSLRIDRSTICRIARLKGVKINRASGKTPWKPSELRF